jgi:hypothetical protein
MGDRTTVDHVTRLIGDMSTPRARLDEELNNNLSTPNILATIVTGSEMTGRGENEHEHLLDLILGVLRHDCQNTGRADSILRCETPLTLESTHDMAKALNLNPIDNTSNKIHDSTRGETSEWTDQEVIPLSAKTLVLTRPLRLRLVEHLPSESKRRKKLALLPKRSGRKASICRARNRARRTEMASRNHHPDPLHPTEGWTKVRPKFIVKWAGSLTVQTMMTARTPWMLS